MKAKLKSSEQAKEQAELAEPVTDNQEGEGSYQVIKVKRYGDN